MPRDDDDIDFAAAMRDRGVAPLGAREEGRRDGDRGRGRRDRAAPATATSPRAPSPDPNRGGLAALAKAEAERDRALAALAKAETERDRAREALAKTEAERDQAREALAKAEAERDQAREALAKALAKTEADRRALSKERAALQRAAEERMAQPPAAPPPVPPTLREALGQRGVDDQDEAAEVLLAVLGQAPGELLDHLRVEPALVERLEDRVALVCERAECQPSGSAAVLRVAAERCEVCGGSDIRAAWEELLRASRRAGITRLVIVGGSPRYHTQLRSLSRGTDLKLDLVPGHSKPGRRRARNSVERVVIWGATIVAHGTTAAYEHLGDRIIRVPHRGISTMLRTVAQALA